MPSERFYVRKTVVPFEEDFYHEFKGHRNIAVEELPPWTQETRTEKASRRAVSRTLNAFLNTGKGGTVYLGVVDSGEVRGLPLTDSQDLFSRYTPPVKRHRYRVKFVPIVENAEEGQTLPKERMASQQKEVKPHTLQTHRYCWCDCESVMMYNAGIMTSDYIIEIKVRAWDPDDPQNQEDGCGSLVKIQPIHENEEKHCYFRRQASLVQYTMNELAQLTRQEVQDVHTSKIARLKQEIAALQKFQESGS